MEDKKFPKWVNCKKCGRNTWLGWPGCWYCEGEWKWKWTSQNAHYAWKGLDGNIGIGNVPSASWV